MKKIRTLLGVSAALCVLSALAFVNNLVAVFNWWRAFAVADGDTTGVPAHAPGCFAWLDWSAVDYSAVTTFIPFLGFCFMTRSAYALVRGRRSRADDFPFFRGSDQLNVALGLFGTLWGIIVIGYFKLETVQMADLMQCLHTALFSTLMAVVWVFLFDRPLVRPYFQKLLAEQHLAEADEGDLTGAVERLVERLGAASDAFDARQRQYESAFDARQRQYESAFDARQRQYEYAFEKRQAEESEAASERQARTDALLAKQLAEQSDAFAKRLSDATGRLADAQSHALADLERVRRETAEQCARQLSEYQQAFEMRQKEYVEFFKREIESLEKRAVEAERRVADAEKHAANSESKIKAVLAALQE